MDYRFFNLYQISRIFVSNQVPCVSSCCGEKTHPWSATKVGNHIPATKRVNGNGSNRPPVPWVESSPFLNWVEWTWVDLEKCQVQGRQHIDFDPSPFDPIRPQSIRPKLFDQKGRPNSFRPISFDPFHAIPTIPITKKQPTNYSNQRLCSRPEELFKNCYDIKVKKLGYM